MNFKLTFEVEKRDLNIQTFILKAYHLIKWGFMFYSNEGISAASFCHQMAAIRKDCFQVKSNLLTVDNLAFHLELQFLIRLK